MRWTPRFVCCKVVKWVLSVVKWYGGVHVYKIYVGVCVLVVAVIVV
jgi:hypothetical protein